MQRGTQAAGAVAGPDCRRPGYCGGAHAAGVCRATAWPDVTPLPSPLLQRAAKFRAPFTPWIDCVAAPVAIKTMELWNYAVPFWPLALLCPILATFCISILIINLTRLVYVGAMVFILFPLGSTFIVKTAHHRWQHRSDPLLSH